MQLSFPMKRGQIVMHESATAKTQVAARTKKKYASKELFRISEANYPNLRAFKTSKTLFCKLSLVYIKVTFPYVLMCSP